MATDLTSSDVVAGNDILATDLNNLRDDVVRRAGDYEDAAGSSNAFTLAIDASIAAYAAGQVFRFQANHSITGAATLNVNSIGAKTIKKPDGLDLGADDIINGQEVTVVYDGTNMQIVSNLGQQFSPTSATVIASDDVVASADTERSSGGAFAGGAVKLKEMTVGLKGTYRFTWDYKSSDASFTAKTQVYRNGSPVGTEKTTTSTSYVSVTDDVSGWSVGDLAQLYVNDDTDGTEEAFLRNFRAKAVVVPVVTVDTD